MKNLYKNLAKGEEIFVGIDLHKKTWHVTIRSTEVELFNGGIPGSWDALKHQLMKFKGHHLAKTTNRRLVWIPRALSFLG